MMKMGTTTKMTDDLVSRWERLLASDTTTRTFSVRTVAMREALDHIKALTMENIKAIDEWRYAILRVNGLTKENATLEKERDALQADNARLRAALGVYAEGWDDDGRLARSTLNTGKEVMPDDARTSRPAHDIGPGDQGKVSGAAPVVYNFDGMSVDVLRRLLEFEDRPPYDRRDAILKALDAKTKPVAGAALVGMIKLKGDTLGLRCATTGCGQHVSVRLERDGVGSDYCEPCGLRAVRS
jgi:hypothetical protein